MIYQCFFAPTHTARLFNTGPYVGFGLEPEVNPSLLTNCPELADPKARMALAEYGAMLHLWRNPPNDGHTWIGFTSYRQLDKTPMRFESVADIESLLGTRDFLSWYVWDLGAVTHRDLTGLAAHSDALHLGLHSFILAMFARFDESIPPSYYTQRYVPYANYWVVPKSRFVSFMEWSWPMIEHALSARHPYLEQASFHGKGDNKARAVGYFMERLFVLWTQQTNYVASQSGRFLMPQEGQKERFPVGLPTADWQCSRKKRKILVSAYRSRDCYDCAPRHLSFQLRRLFETAHAREQTMG